MRLKRFAWILVGLMAATGVARAEVFVPLTQLVDRMAHSEERAVYLGTQVVEERTNDGVRTTVRRVWADRGRTRVEFCDPRTGLDRILIDDGRFTYNYAPRLAMYSRVPSSLQDELIRRAGKLRSLFASGNTRALSEQTFLGRKTSVLECGAASGDTIVWVDHETGLPLRMERYGPAGRLTYRMAFTDIAFAAEIPRDLFKMPASPVLTVYSNPFIFDRDLRLIALARDAGMPVLVPRRLPPGARLTTAEVIRLQERRLLHVQLRAKETVLSLFQMADKENTPEMQRRIKERLKTLLAGKNVSIIEWRAEGRRFVLIGNMGRTQLRAIAASPLDPFAWN